MQLYSATIRLSGSLYNEVRKDELTAAEVEVLRRIHGSDAVVHLQPVGEIKRTDEEERDRLRGLYGRALRTIESVKTIEAILGVNGVPLPKSIKGVDALPPPKTGKRAVIPATEPAELAASTFE